MTAALPLQKKPPPLESGKLRVGQPGGDGEAVQEGGAGDGRVSAVGADDVIAVTAVNVSGVRHHAIGVLAVVVVDVAAQDRHVGRIALVRRVSVPQSRRRRPRPRAG